jgi:hypothetical protein
MTYSSSDRVITPGTSNADMARCDVVAESVEDWKGATSHRR